jgi:hypothetical protein
MSLTQLSEPQISPTAQNVPLASPVHPPVLTPGWQLAHALPGSRAPLAYDIPAISHPLPQLPPVQMRPLPQLFPFITLLHPPVLAEGWQLWQMLFVFTVPGL